MWAIVGLGNPGRKYSRTRHNAGFLFIESTAGSWNTKIRKMRFLSRTATLHHKSQELLLAMPQTYMNLSGYAVREIISANNIADDHLLVVFDDLDIPLGEIRVRKEGGPGTHKGMLSIVQEIQTTQFPRIRIGIGPLPENREATDFVLSPFEKDERLPLDRSLEYARGALDMILAGEIDRAMNTFNRREMVKH